MLDRNKIWGILDWLATSVLIFVLIFFVLNFTSYKELFISKISQIYGNNTIVNTVPNYQPLPVITNPDIAKKQIPDLNMEIMPPDDRIYIQRINQNVPIVQVSTDRLIKKDWGGLEKQIQEALRDGVVHYPGTAFPGDKGNAVVTGHSSYFPWDPGRFKDVFALLHQVDVGDEIDYFYNQKKYRYKVYEKKVVTPDKVDVLLQNGDEKLTLITCTPVGTNLKRLIVLAKPVDSANSAQ